MSNQVRDKTCQNITKREQNDQFKIVTQRGLGLIINYVTKQGERGDANLCYDLIKIVSEHYFWH